MADAVEENYDARFLNEFQGASMTTVYRSTSSSHIPGLLAEALRVGSRLCKQLPWAACLLFCTTIGAVPVRASEIPLYASPDLGLSSPVPSEADLAKPFSDPLPIITRNTSGAHEEQISSCQDWLDLKDPIVDSDNGRDYSVVMIQSVICGGLDLLRKARPAKETALPSDFLEYRDLRKYPATIWVSISKDDIAKASRPGASLRDLTGKTTFQVENQKELSLTSGARKLTLTLLARGDFDGSGWDSAAFDWEGSLNGGSYDVNRLVILTRRSTGEAFKEIQLAPVLER